MDINTATPSTITSTEPNVGTQTQRKSKSDISFNDMGSRRKKKMPHPRCKRR